MAKLLKIFFSSMLLAGVISCATTPRPDNSCPEVKREKCAGKWACQYDRRGCEECVCAPFYLEKPAAEEALTPIEIQ